MLTGSSRKHPRHGWVILQGMWRESLIFPRPVVQLVSQSVSQRFPMLKNESERHGAARGATDIVGTARLWALRISVPHGAASC